MECGGMVKYCAEAPSNIDYNSGSPDVQNGPNKLMCSVHDKLEEHHHNYQHPNYEDTCRPRVECDKPQEGRE